MDVLDLRRWFGEVQRRVREFGGVLVQKFGREASGVDTSRESGRLGSNSILLAAVAHTFFNRSNNNDGVAADLLTGTQREIAALLATVFLVAVLGVVNRRRLTRAVRRRLDRAESAEV